MLSVWCVVCGRSAHSQTCVDGKFIVTNETQLQNALDCIADDCAGLCVTCPGGCPTEVVIPAGTTIDITDTIAIYGDHNGTILTINGTLNSDGAFTGTMIDLADSVNITVRGSGLVTTDDIASSTGPVISQAIRIADCTNVTVEGLDFLNVARMVTAEFELSNGITLSNLDGVDIRNYGVWIGGGSDGFDQNVTISNCTVNDVKIFHGFRIYGNNVSITDCEAYDCGAHGLWMIEGTGVLIDGFTSNDLIRIGPNHTGPDNGERLRCVVARNISGTFHPTDECIRIGVGTQGLYMENIFTTGVITIHDRPSDGIPRPTDRIHWRNVTADAASVDVESLLCPDYGPCLGDINNDNLVNVDDLLAVVNNWGACPTPIPGQGECYQCLADIVPFQCGSGTVNVDDLLAVINDWGCTYTTLGNEDNSPRSVI